MKNFFITGLPRSRISWFTNLFLTERTFCFHEWLMDHSKGMIETFQSINKEYVGNSDCGLVVFYELIEKHFSDAPLVLIERDPEESMDAMLNAFPYMNKDSLKKSIFALYQNMQRIKQEREVLVVPFEKCGEMAEDVWNYCIPTIPFDKKRADILEKLKVTVTREVA